MIRRSLSFSRRCSASASACARSSCCCRSRSLLSTAASARRAAAAAARSAVVATLRGVSALLGVLHAATTTLRRGVVVRGRSASLLCSWCSALLLLQHAGVASLTSCQRWTASVIIRAPRSPPPTPPLLLTTAPLSRPATNAKSRTCAWAAASATSACCTLRCTDRCADASRRAFEAAAAQLAAKGAPACRWRGGVRWAAAVARRRSESAAALSRAACVAGAGAGAAGVAAADGIALLGFFVGEDARPVAAAVASSAVLLPRPSMAAHNALAAAAIKVCRPTISPPRSRPSRRAAAPL